MKKLFVLAALVAALTCPSFGQEVIRPEPVPVDGETCPPETAAEPRLMIAPAPGPAGPQGPRGATGVSGETRVIVRHRTIARGPNRAQEYRQNLNDFRDMGGVTRGEVAAGYYNKTESDAAHIGLAGMGLSSTPAARPVVVAPAAGSAVAPEEGKKMGAFEWLALLGLVGLILVALAASNRQPASPACHLGLQPGGRSASTPLTADAAIEKGYEVVWHDTPTSSYLRAVPRQLQTPAQHGLCVGEGEALVRVRVTAADVRLGACSPEQTKPAPAPTTGTPVVGQTFNFGALFGGAPGANQPAGQQPDARKGGGKSRQGGAQGGRDEVPAQTN